MGGGQCPLFFTVFLIWELPLLFFSQTDSPQPELGWLAPLRTPRQSPFSTRNPQEGEYSTQTAATSAIPEPHLNLSKVDWLHCEAQSVDWFCWRTQGFHQSFFEATHSGIVTSVSDLHYPGSTYNIFVARRALKCGLRLGQWPMVISKNDPILVFSIFATKCAYSTVSLQYFNLCNNKSSVKRIVFVLLFVCS